MGTYGHQNHHHHNQEENSHERKYSQSDIPLLNSHCLTSDPPVTAVPALVLPNRSIEIFPPKIRPQRIDKDKLGVGQLPEQEVRDPILT
jgi:hypothetical protein